MCQEQKDRYKRAYAARFPGVTAARPPDLEQLRTLLNEVGIPDHEATLDALARLRPPEEIEAEVRRAVAATRRSLARLKADPLRYDPFVDSDNLLAQVRLEVCAD